MTTWARVEASRHDHTASHHLMQAPTSQLVRKRVEKERIERAFRLQDRDRSGVVTEADLHCFYKGHIGRTLKRFAKRKNARRRTLRTWLCGSGASVLLTLPFWGMVVSVVMVAGQPKKF